MKIKKPRGIDRTQQFNAEVLFENAENQWAESSVEGIPTQGSIISPMMKLENEKAILQFSTDAEKATSRRMLQEVLQKFLLEGPIFSSSAKQVFRDPGFFRSSEEFTKKVQKYDPEMKKEDIGQAFRNVWIMNLLQKTFMLPVTCTPGIFGYSMLYPYTDNFMDDPDIQREDKHRAWERLNQRLSGEEIIPRGKQEKKIYNMIEHIEQSYSREFNPDVYESLLYIHRCQRESLKQQSTRALHQLGDGDTLDAEMREMLKISFHKGGASVLADGYLIKGALSIEEQKFCYNYGVLLQLADDLQDCKEDFENQHKTLFSMDYSINSFDSRTRQLILFAEKTYRSFFSENTFLEMENFLTENTLLLILGSVLMHPDCFSEEFISWAEERFPVSRSFLADQQQGFKDKLKNSKLYSDELSFTPVVK